MTVRLSAGAPPVPYHTLLPDVEIHGDTCDLSVRDGDVRTISYSADVLSLLALAVRMRPSSGTPELMKCLEVAGLDLRILSAQACIDAMNSPPAYIADSIHAHQSCSRYVPRTAEILARHPRLSTGVVRRVRAGVAERTYGEMFAVSGLHIRREYARRLARCAKFEHLVRCQNAMRRTADASYADAYMMDFDDAYARIVRGAPPA